MHKRITAVICAIACALSVTSCSSLRLFMRKHGYNDSEYSVTVVSNINKLEDNSYYVRKSDGKYYKPYVGESSFLGRNTAKNRQRVLWFGKDYDRIPTMNKGDTIVYHSTDEFSPRFRIERFQDIGYTIGICNMSPTSAGRYTFSTDPLDRCIDIDSNAGTLYSLGDHTVTMEMIGDAELRSGNISQAGTIIGLERGKTYAADVYIGTEVMQYSFVADVRALSSMDSYTINDFQYEQSKVVSFVFPDYFNSGYYLIDGFGLVRYVASTDEYNDSMAMNVPNADPSEGEEESVYAPVTATTETVPFRVDEKAAVEITVHLDTVVTRPDEGNDNAVEPRARVIGKDGSYALNLTEKGDALTGTYELEPGDYRIEITGLAGRSYSYRVSKRAASE